MAQDYWTRKYKLCKALIEEKEATIRRIECELEGLYKRKERIGKAWVRSRKKGTDGQARARSTGT